MSGGVTSFPGSRLENVSTGGIGSAHLTISNGFANEGTITFMSTYQTTLTVVGGPLVNNLSASIVGGIAAESESRGTAATITAEFVNFPNFVCKRD